MRNKICQPQKAAFFNIAYAEDMAATHDTSARHQVFTDLSMCATDQLSSGIYCFGFYLN